MRPIVPIVLPVGRANREQRSDIVAANDIGNAVTREELLQAFSTLIQQTHTDVTLRHMGELQAIIAAGFHEGRGMDFGPDPADVAAHEPALIRERPVNERAGEVLGRVAEELVNISDLVSEGSVDDVRRVMFDELDFRGDTATYYAPANSLISDVLRSRQGNPITLSVVMIEIAFRSGVEIHAVGMPGHFLTTEADGDRFFDPFNGGRALTAGDCAALWSHMAQQPAAAFNQAWLTPVPTGRLVARTIANLRVAVGATRDIHGLRWIAQLASNVPEVPPAFLAQMATTLAEFGQLRHAAQLFEHAASVVDREGSAGFATTGEGAPSQALMERAMTLRSQLN